VEVGINFNGIYPADCDLSFLHLKRLFSFFFHRIFKPFYQLFSVRTSDFVSSSPKFHVLLIILATKKLCHQISATEKKRFGRLMACFFIDGREFSAKNGARFQLQTVKYRRFAMPSSLIVFSSFEIAPLAFIALLRNGLCGECPSPKYKLRENSALS
jgi:hypothetical protein